MSKNNLDILPVTKVSQLLDAYPELEAELIQLSPAFKKLRNPVLRKTVAKLATLAQAAKIGKVPVAQLVNTLRAAVGQEPINVQLTDEITASEPPPWMKNITIVNSLDSRPLLDAGEFPLTRVLADLKLLEQGQSYELIAPFLPAPMIDKVIQKGYACWAQEDAAHNLFRVYFTKLR
jgi:hypothetical protein